MSRRMARGTGVLATIGATAPFVGLFGTVWGIMNAFIGISEAQTTNLAVVAPGIAEALLATALGLVAAIPAVVIYNRLARSIAGYRALLGDASAQVHAADQPRTEAAGARLRAVARRGVASWARRLADTRTRRRRRSRRSPRDQRHAVHRRDAGAADHLHGGRAAGDRRFGVDLPASAVEPQPRPDKPVFVTVKPDLTLAVGEDIIAARRADRDARHRDQAAQGRAHLPARRQDRQLWRPDGGDEPAAQRRLSQDRAGRPRRTDLTRHECLCSARVRRSCRDGLRWSASASADRRPACRADRARRGLVHAAAAAGRGASDHHGGHCAGVGLAPAAADGYPAGTGDAGGRPAPPPPEPARHGGGSGADSRRRRRRKSLSSKRRLSRRRSRRRRSPNRPRSFPILRSRYRRKAEAGSHRGQKAERRPPAPRTSAAPKAERQAPASIRVVRAGATSRRRLRPIISSSPRICSASSNIRPARKPPANRAPRA